MSIKGVVEAIRWQFVKLINMFLKLQTIHWMPQENIDLAETFDKYNNDEFFFVQIGANDGITGDSLRKYIEKYEWRGILVEPVPYVFKRLMDNYKGFQNLHFENAAVSSITGHSKFYSVNEYDLDNNNLFEKYDAYKIDQLSSFDLKTVMKHSYMHPNFEKLITEVDIPTISFDDLINKYKVHKIDLLQIDCEGYDFEILNAIDLTKVAPAIIIFEHQHINLNDYKKLINKTKQHGYKNHRIKWDTVSIKM